jgi:mannose-1-phosphate guanylyltransferase/mannose-6-phosphate isomerase
MLTEVILERGNGNNANVMAQVALQVEAVELLLSCPADHHIPNGKAVAAMVEWGGECASNGTFITFGTASSFSSGCYVYIERGAMLAAGGDAVNRFFIKRSIEKAGTLILQGNVLWNTDILWVKISVLLDVLKIYAPYIQQSRALAMDSARRDSHYPVLKTYAFNTCRSACIVYALLEKYEKVVCLLFFAPGATLEAGMLLPNLHFSMPSAIVWADKV